MPILNFKRRLSNEAGFILPTAVIVLLILTVLIGAAVTVASQTSTSTTRDSNSKAALEAAEAGLQVATFRLSKLAPEEAECITGTAKGSPTSGVDCESSKEPLGNGATFQYWTSKALAAGAACGGVKAEANQRCITSEGIVNGVTPGTRLQTLVKTSHGEPLFAVHGILGLEEVHVSGSVKIPGLSASNGLVLEEGGAALEGGYELGPSPPSKFEKKGGATVKAPEKTRTASEGKFAAPLPATHATKESNEDSRITECTVKGCAVAGKDEFYTAGKAVNKFTGSPNYELKLGSLGELTLSGSKYFLCNFHAEHAGKLIIAAGAKVEIFVGSPEGASKCPAGTGKFETEEFQLENHAGPGSLVIIMEGKGPFLVSRGALFEGGVYAPEAEVTFEGGAEFTGGIVGKKVHIANGVYFKWSEALASWPNGAGGGAYERKTWEQCTPGSGASEGC